MGPIVGVLFRTLARPAVQAAIVYTVRQAAEASHRRQTQREHQAAHPSPAAARHSFRIAVLGESEAGKTTLINSWMGTWLENPPHTRAPIPHGDIKRTKGGLLLIFEAVMDVGGNPDQLPHWDNLVEDGAGRHVLYLVDARRLAEAPTGRHVRDPYRLEDDARRIQESLVRERDMLSIVVVTHTDQDPRRSSEGLNRYEEIIREQLDPVILLLGGDRLVRLVSGSLADPAGADQLTDRITEHLLQWTP